MKKQISFMLVLCLATLTGFCFTPPTDPPNQKQEYAFTVDNASYETVAVMDIASLDVNYSCNVSDEQTFKNKVNNKAIGIITAEVPVDVGWSTNTYYNLYKQNKATEEDDCKRNYQTPTTSNMRSSFEGADCLSAEALSLSLHNC